MTSTIETVIVGGGQAGLSVGYYLSARGREYTILEKAQQPGHAWRNDRWDSFTLVTPNWTVRLPGAEYAGSQPDAFMPRDELVRRLEAFVTDNRLPVEFGVQVDAVEPLEAPEAGYLVRTSRGPLRAKNVVMATGLYQSPKIPEFAARLPAGVLQIHSGQYRNPGQLPPGAVLVAGGGQSGCQIAEELYQSGRKVYLSTAKVARAPRRYRGKDIFEWIILTGLFERAPGQVLSYRERFGSNPLVTGKDGGHTLNLHRFACDGVRLLGRMQDARDGKIFLAPDLAENLEQSDLMEKRLLQRIDRYIETAGLDAPAETLPELRDGFDQPAVSELGLSAEGISTVIWSMGYNFDFSLVKLPVVDEVGFPLSENGETPFAGLYFAGLPWLPAKPTGLLLGVGKQAEYVANRICAG